MTTLPVRMKNPKNNKQRLCQILSSEFYFSFRDVLTQRQQHSSSNKHVVLSAPHSPVPTLVIL